MSERAGAGRLAPAKVNLYLHVGPPGADGYHPVCSLMAFADVGDWLTARPSEALGLSVEGPFAAALAGEGDNLVLRAVRALLAQAGAAQRPLHLTLDKQLPVAAGLGGGSSDAGAALRLVRDQLNLPVEDGALEAVAASLGADGAACLWGRAVTAEGRGQRLGPAPALPELHAVLVNPGVPVSTPEVYRRFDAGGRFGEVAPPAGPAAFEDAPALADWLSRLRNDLEGPAVAVAPEVGNVLATLRSAPQALLARVSGSGGTCFALCAGPAEAQALARRIAAAARGWWVRPCRLA